MVYCERINENLHPRNNDTDGFHLNNSPGFTEKFWVSISPENNEISHKIEIFLSSNRRSVHSNA
jgi:hypothetical protein